MRGLIGVLLLGAATNAAAQLPNQDYRGVAATGIALRKLATTKRVLVIGAHPDDEDNQLLTVLSLAQGAGVAYLSLNRGEGGQNIIGGELGPALGVLRTGELLAEHELDGSRQYFTRAYDFGYSKTADETLQEWPRDSVLADVVAVVRRFQPDIIVAMFSGTPRDGHGHHQVSGMLAREAFVAAADPGRFPQQIRAGLMAHRTLKLIQATGYRQMAATQQLPSGELDPLLGRSYAQIAAASRSRQRSQGEGQLQVMGPRGTSVRLLESLVPIGADSTLWAGMDTTLTMHAATVRAPANVAHALQRYDSLLAAARGRLSAYHTDDVAIFLAAALRELNGARPAIHDAGLRETVARKAAATQVALLQAARVVIDAISSTERVVADEAFTLDLTVWNGGGQPVRVLDLAPLIPAAWAAERTDSASDVVAPGMIVTRRFTIHPPPDAAISQPYFLAKPRPGDYYAWPSADSVAGLPFAPAPVRGSATLEVLGVEATTSIAATRRLVEQTQGELRRAVHVVPAFTLRPEPATAVIPLTRLTTGSDRLLHASVELGANGRGGRIVVKPRLPAGWRSTPADTSLVLNASGETETVDFAIEPSRNIAAASYEVRFEAADDRGRTYDLTQRVIDYPHITNRVMFAPAVSHVTVLDARFAHGMRIGYVVGTDTKVPGVLEQLGIAVDRLDEAALATGDLSRYDAIVIGSRAYETRRDLIAHNARILDYGRKGGNVLVLYQQYQFIQGKFAPYELTLARPHDRITDENSPVRLLQPDAFALTRPNRITQQDFAGWVQERALYMPHTWAPEFRPLLEMNDPGEAPSQGAIVTAPLGAGVYTYTGIAFFRELPAGVPGAVRLFINLLSLGMRDAAF